LVGSEEIARISYNEFIRLLYERDAPEEQELTIGKVIRIEDHGIYVLLEEYNKEAYIPLKELSTRLIKHPRELVKLNQKVVVKIYRIRRHGMIINASLKRVLPGERQKKLQEWRKLRKSLIIMQQIADKLGKPIEEVIKNLGRPLIDYYDTPYDGFEEMVKWGEKVLEDINIPKEWIPVISDVVHSNIRLKEISLKRYLLIRTLAPDGITRIKKALSEGKKVAPDRIEIEYISSPRYLIRIKGFDWKDVTKIFDAFYDKVKVSLLENNEWPTVIQYEELEAKKKAKRKE